jgi:C4-dicarboxylate-specific signal transduction histidine kinase
MIKDVFTPFSTSKEKGMGIGLSISRTIVVAHGGQLNFYNNKSFGATFYFTLPAAKVGE